MDKRTQKATRRKESKNGHSITLLCHITARAARSNHVVLVIGRTCQQAALVASEGVRFPRAEMQALYLPPSRSGLAKRADSLKCTCSCSGIGRLLAQRSTEWDGRRFPIWRSPSQESS